MILGKEVRFYGKEKSNSPFGTECLNEIRSENIKYIVGMSGYGGVGGYIVYYEDENIYACPECGHHISNTFTYCPNCAHKMDPSRSNAPPVITTSPTRLSTAPIARQSLNNLPLLLPPPAFRGRFFIGCLQKLDLN